MNVGTRHECRMLIKIKAELNYSASAKAYVPPWYVNRLQDRGVYSQCVPEVS